MIIQQVMIIQQIPRPTKPNTGGYTIRQTDISFSTSTKPSLTLSHSRTCFTRSFCAPEMLVGNGPPQQPTAAMMTTTSTTTSTGTVTIATV